MLQLQSFQDRKTFLFSQGLNEAKPPLACDVWLAFTIEG